MRYSEVEKATQRQGKILAKALLQVSAGAVIIGALWVAPVANKRRLSMVVIKGITATYVAVYALGKLPALFRGFGRR